MGGAAAVGARGSGPPAGAGTTVYASWNGATQLASWRVMAGASTGRLAGVKSAVKSGFETAIALPQGYTSFQLEALDARGRVIGTSPAFSQSE